MVAIIDYIFSIFGYSRSSRMKQKSPVPGNDYKQKECLSDKKNIVFRDGAMRTGIVHDSSGKPFLMGGFCIELEDSDEEREMYGVNQNGWNGTTIEAKISGDGLITLATQVQLDCNDYIYTGDIASLDYVPYWTIGEGPEGYRRPDHYWY